MAIYLYARFTENASGTEYTRDRGIKEFTAADSEAEILGSFKANMRHQGANPKLTHCVITTDEGGAEEDLKIYEYYWSEGKQILVPVFYEDDRAGDITLDWEYSATYEPLWLDTSTGPPAVDTFTFPGHVCQYIAVYNNGTGDITAGDLCSYNSNDADKRHYVELRGSGKTAEPPAGVALDDIDEDCWGRMAIAGFCDVTTSDDRSATSGTLFASETATEYHEVTTTPTDWLVGTAAGGVGSSYVSTWARVQLSLAAGTDPDSITLDSEAWTAVLSGLSAPDLQEAMDEIDGHEIEDHLNTTATGAELETLTDGSDADSLHTHNLKLNISDIDDSPVNGETSAPISSNWAYDHDADEDAHHLAIYPPLPIMTDRVLYTDSGESGHINFSSVTQTELQTLTDASDADSLHTHGDFVKHDGSVVMTGDLDTDGNDVDFGATGKARSLTEITTETVLNVEFNNAGAATARWRNDVSGQLEFDLEGDLDVDGDADISGDITTSVMASRVVVTDGSKVLDAATMTSAQLDDLMLWEDTSTGADAGTWQGHKCAYITLQNESGSTISAGDLVVYDDDSSTYQEVKTRDAADELPIGVALAEAEDGEDVKVGIAGFCDVNLYTDTWKSTTVGEKTSAQNFPIRCSYVRGNYEKCIIDDFFGSSDYDMSGYGHLLGTAVSEAGIGYASGKVRVQLNIVQQSKAPLEAMTHGGDLTLWLRNFKDTDEEPLDGTDYGYSSDNWLDLTPWNNDFAWSAYPSGSEPSYERDTQNGYGVASFTVGNYDNLTLKHASYGDDTYLHDNNDGLSIMAWGNWNADSDCIIAKYNTSGNDRCFYLRTHAAYISEDGTYSATLYDGFTRPTSFGCVGFVWGTGEVMTTYVNGTSTGTTSATCTDLPDSTTGSDLHIGCDRHAQASNLDGDIAEITAFKHKLTSGELSALIDEGEERYGI